MGHGGKRKGAGRKPGIKDPVKRVKWSGYLAVHNVAWLKAKGIDKKGKSQGALIDNALEHTYTIDKAPANNFDE